MKSLVFYSGLGLIITHEMDAIANHEWRVLPLLRLLPENTGEMTFLIAHVPILALTIAFVASLNQKTRILSQRLVCGFLVVHAVLHFAFSGQPQYEFTSFVSSALIYGAAICGTAYFLILGIERHRNVT